MTPAPGGDKLRIVTEAEEPGACARAGAVRLNGDPGSLHRWRQVREARLAAPTLD